MQIAPRGDLRSTGRVPSGAGLTHGAVLRLVIGSFVVSIATVACVFAAGCGGAETMGAPPAPYAGATLANPALAPDFALRDQHRQLVRLRHERGNVVLLTFLYTHCPDVCPLTAINLNAALGLVGPSRKEVSVLAVTVDPQGDTPTAVASFVRSHHLRRQFHYLTGSPPALRRIWSAYQVKAVRQGKDAGVDHTLYTLGIDRQGVARVVFDATAQPGVIAHDLGLLLRVSGE